MKSSDYLHQKPGRLMRLLWTASGSDAELLKKCTYSDQVRAGCLGGIVLGTGCMAALAGGYAVYTIFSPKGPEPDETKEVTVTIIAVLVGAAWGLLIYNLDRFIISCVGKPDGTGEITAKKLKNALPRIILGALISIVIAKPLEIRMFKNEIDARLHKEELTRAQEYDRLSAASYHQDVAEVNAELGGIQQQRTAFMNRIVYLEQQATEETRGLRGNPGGHGPEAKILEGHENGVKQDLVNFNLSVHDREKELKAKKEAITRDFEATKLDNKRAAASMDGLLERIILSFELSPAISLFLSLFFMSIELTPIFFKMMLTKSPYHYMLENAEQIALIRQLIEIRPEACTDGSGLQKDTVILHEVDQRKALLALHELEEPGLNQLRTAHWVAQEKRLINAEPAL